MVILGIVIFENPNIGFYIIIFSVFFSDWFMQLGLIPPQMTLLPEVILLILIIKVGNLRAKDKIFIPTPIDLPILLFIFWAILSTLFNAQKIETTIIAFRYDLKYIIMFVLLINLNPNERFFKRMIRIFIVLLLVQVPVALVKMKIYGQGESAIGTYAVHGGVPSTILPLIAISIFLGFFLFEKPRFRYIFLSLCFVLFSIIGGKRAFPFFGTLLFLFLFWQTGKRNFAKVSFVAPFLMVGFLASVYFVPSLNPTFKDPHYLLDYSSSYSTAHSSETGKAVGRTSALITAFEIAKENPSNFLLGFGPGSLAPSHFKEYESDIRQSLPISYGKSQWVTMSLEYGWVGALLYLWLFIPLFRINQRFFQITNDKYWKSISFGYKGILFAYLLGFFYAVIFRDDLLSFIFWFFAATIYCMEKRKNLKVEELQWNPEK